MTTLSKSNDGPFKPGAAILACLLVSACGPSGKQAATVSAEPGRECKDVICPGDVPPKFDPLKEYVAKLNGEWFIGPREYGGYGGSLAFFWPSKTPANSPDANKLAPEFVPSAAGQTSNFYEVGIEIFLRSSASIKSHPTRYDDLIRAEVEGRLIKREVLRPGLEVWHTRETDGLGPGLWYVATQYAKSHPNAAVLACANANPKLDRCTTAFEWKPGIGADMRFRASHAPDWPEILQEAVRVLDLVKKAQLMSTTLTAAAIQTLQAEEAQAQAGQIGF